MNSAIIGILWGVLKHVIAQPIVKVALDNWTKGTSNKVDDWVWKMLKLAAAIKDEASRKAYVIKEVALLQERYDYARDEGILNEMKRSKKVWDMASLNLDSSSESGNIA